MNEQAMFARVREDGLLARGRAVVVLLSGGRDSTCLLDLAVRVAGADAVSALHVNYGLRGASSDADERACRELCERRGVALEVRRPAPHARGNLQAWAREVRYREAGELARERSADLAAGHTATDQVETILYRLASSPSRRALLGMEAREGSLVRPLLGFTREDTAEYCRARGLAWREDESNDTAAYARNRVRTGLLPALSELHPAALRNVLAVAEVLRDEAEVLDGLVAQVLTGDVVSLQTLRELDPALRRLVVQRLADEAAGGFAPGAGRRADELAALTDRGTAMLDIGCGLRAVAEYGRLRIEPLGLPVPEAPEVSVLAIPGQVMFGSLNVRCEVGAPAREPGVIDRAALGTHLLVRSWRPGDRMAPLGLGGATKSLQDLFTARRVPRLERARVPVVESGGEIVWVAGVATSERFKITSGTREAVRLSCREGERARDTAPIESGGVEGDDAIGEILVPAEDLTRRIRELAAEVSRDYAGKDLLLVGVLKGAVLFLSDLMRHLEVPCEVDFMAVASYGSATTSSGVVRILKDLDMVIEGRNVLIVEDIVDSGLTLQYLLRNLEGRNPRSLEVCALLVKPERQKVDLRTKYVGFEIPNRFVIGYGLDFDERYRNLPYVAELKE